MEKPPQKTSEDIVHASVKGLVSGIPYAGGPLSVALENIFASPIERRREKWFEKLAEVVSELEQRVADLSAQKLSENELFVTVTLQATQIAIRNHQEEKIKALRSAVFQAGLPDGPDEELQLMFLQFIDELSPGRLQLLALLDDPIQWMQRNNIQNPGWSMGGVSAVIEHCFPHLRGKRQIYGQLVRDLQAKGLIHQGEFLNLTMTGRGMVKSRTTEIGQKFIAYISEEK